SVQHSNERGIRFRFDVEQVITPGAVVPQHLLLSWFNERQTGMRKLELPVLHAGERWCITVRLKQPHGSMNPHGFDYEVWALERNIRATGYVRPSADHELLQPMVSRPEYWIEHFREEIQQRFAAH
ncbi:ComEC/Rec2 family competence protein, partial [Nitrosococcus oceani]